MYIKYLCYLLDQKCTAATSTEELLSYSSIEVQTAPYDLPESESETNDEPIENLSVNIKLKYSCNRHTTEKRTFHSC